MVYANEGYTLLYPERAVWHSLMLEAPFTVQGALGNSNQATTCIFYGRISVDDDVVYTLRDDDNTLVDPPFTSFINILSELSHSYFILSLHSNAAIYVVTHGMTQEIYLY